MTCADLPSGDLPYTGAPLAALLALGAGCVILGLLLLIAARTGKAKMAFLTLLLLAVSGALVASGTGEASAERGAPECTVRITQTFDITGLAPGVSPAPITGEVVNTGSESVYVTAVTASISSVVSAPGSRPGCDRSDYLLLTPTMPVGRTLAPAESASFTGAFLGFNNKHQNQDNCKSAMVTLTYTIS